MWISLTASRATRASRAVSLADPIFQGLAISLLFGLASSTLLTVLVIPAIYRVLRTWDIHRPGSTLRAQQGKGCGLHQCLHVN